MNMDKILTSVEIKKNLYIRLRKKLLEADKSFSAWLEEQIKNFLNK